MPASKQPTFGNLFSTEPDKPRKDQALTPLPSAPRTMLEDEFRPHFEAWQTDPSPANVGALLKAVDPVVKSALRTYTTQGAVSPTVRSKAKLIVLDSLPRYDPARAKLRTHLMVNLQSLRRAHAEENQIISVPERVRLDQYHLHQAEQELADRLGRDPSDAELSEHTGLSVRRLAHVRKAKLGLAEGQVVGLPNEQGEETRAEVGVVNRDSDDTWIRFIYQDLDPKDQVILEHVMGLNGKPVLPKGEIARKLGLSAGAVSQRAARIQKLIDSREELAQNLF